MYLYLYKIMVKDIRHLYFFHLSEILLPVSCNRFLMFPIEDNRLKEIQKKEKI